MKNAHKTFALMPERKLRNSSESVAAFRIIGANSSSHHWNSWKKHMGWKNNCLSVRRSRSFSQMHHWDDQVLIIGEEIIELVKDEPVLVEEMYVYEVPSKTWIILILLYQSSNLALLVY